MATKKRAYGGRKSVTDKKIPVQVYVLQSQVDKLGGIEIARNIALTVLEGTKKVKVQ